MSTVKFSENISESFELTFDDELEDEVFEMKSINLPRKIPLKRLISRLKICCSKIVRRVSDDDLLITEKRSLRDYIILNFLKR
jgi:hypothetical protein